MQMILKGLIVVLLIVGCSPSHETTDASGLPQVASIRIEGEVAGCFARTRVFTIIADIYAFDLRSNMDLFTQLKALPQESPTSENIEAFTAVTDTFIRSVKQRANMARRTRSDGNGRYVLTGLERDAEYLVIAIVPPQEDSEEYFLQRTTGRLSNELTTLDLWAEDTPKEQCHP